MSNLESNSPIWFESLLIKIYDICLKFFGSYGFGYGLRPKAEVFQGRTFGYGRRWKLGLRSNTAKDITIALANLCIGYNSSFSISYHMPIVYICTVQDSILFTISIIWTYIIVIQVNSGSGLYRMLQFIIFYEEQIFQFSKLQFNLRLVPEVS